MGEMSPWHWLIVIGIAALLFGAKRLPDAARAIGRSTRILKSELRADDGPAPAPAPPAAATAVPTTTAAPTSEQPAAAPDHAPSA